MRKSTRHGGRSVFSLIELLVTVAIIAILAALLLPALVRAKYQARNILCVNNLSQLTRGVHIYASDYDSCYPFRGTSANDPMVAGNAGGGLATSKVARFAARLETTDNANAPYRLDRLMGPYVPTNIGTWCCPLYQGTVYGSTKRGIPTSGMHRLTITYAMFGGIDAWQNTATVTANTAYLGSVKRHRMGEPFRLVYGGRTFDLNFMWADGGMDIQNMWTVGRTVIGGINGIGTNHEPPPGVPYRFSDVTRREIHAFGPSVASWSFDDGSARSFRVPILGNGNGYSAGWHYVTSDNSRWAYLPEAR